MTEIWEGWCRLMRKLVYTNSRNESIDLTKYVIVSDAASLFSRSWNSETSQNKLIGFSKKVATYSITLDVIGKDSTEKANHILNVLEKDVIFQKSGTLKCDDWYLKGYFVKSSTGNYVKFSNRITLKLTFTSDLNYWIKESLYIYRKNDEQTSDRGLGYAYDFPYDYLSPISSAILTNSNFMDSPFIMTIYGAVVNPKVIIGGHVYEVETTLDSNEYLIINAYDKTITKVKKNGERVNEFALRNKESYIFQKIAPGDNTVIINPLCNVDVVVMSERGEPEWT
ncbi:MAG: hypothetical protein KBT03_10880 [Bacteroidales bacterium]|nr:hypothetical protein [Candidatus Scybalousia scybalohippi]